MNAMSIYYSLNIFLIFFSSVACYGQATVKIILSGEHLNGITKIEMYDFMHNAYHTKPYTDSLSFSFKRAEKVDLYTLAFYKGEQRFGTKLWLDDAAITIYAHLNESDLIVDSVLNSPIYTRAAQFYKDLNGLKADEKNDFYIRSFKENADNAFSLEIAARFLNQNSMFKEALTEMKSLLDNQGNVYYGRPDHQNLVDKMYSLMRIDHIDLTKYDFLNRMGENGKIDYPKAKYYLLDFWFVNCLPCRVDHKKIKQNEAFFEKNNVAVVGLSIDRNHKEWNDYLDEHNYAWTNYRIEKGNSLTDDLVVSAYPTYYLFDADLKYQGIFSNVDDFAYLFLDKLL